MTPYDVALFMMRRRTVDPDFIVAYLVEEASRAGADDPLRLSQHPMDRMRFQWRDIKGAFAPLRTLLRALGDDLDAEGETTCLAH